MSVVTKNARIVYPLVAGTDCTVQSKAEYTGNGKIVEFSSTGSSYFSIQFKVYKDLLEISPDHFDM